jgi:hypothetical protein
MVFSHLTTLLPRPEISSDIRRLANWDRRRHAGTFYQSQSVANPTASRQDLLSAGCFGYTKAHFRIAFPHGRDDHNSPEPRRFPMSLARD